MGWLIFLSPKRNIPQFKPIAKKTAIAGGVIWSIGHLLVVLEQVNVN
jgi:hypothetical protein